MAKITEAELREHFPYDKYEKMRPNQDRSFKLIAKEDGNVLLEEPPGSGKTVIGMTFLKTLRDRGEEGPLFYITPTKSEVDQVFRQYPDDVTPVYGRGEYQCLYYEPDQQFKANEIPCLFLTDCPHRVDQATGETHTPGAPPCPYYQAKFLAKQRDIVPCTMHFFVFTQLFSREWESPAGLVVDEADLFAQVVRSCLSYDITDYNLRRIIDILSIPDIDTKKEKAIFRKFLARMVKIVKRRSKHWGLLEDSEIVELVNILEEINPDRLKAKVMEAIRSGKIDKLEQVETLKQLEVVTYDLRRYIHSFEYSLATDKRGPLNYTAGYYVKKRDKDDRRKVEYKLVVHSHFVSPLIQKRLLSPSRTLAYSGTVGNPEVFAFENGIKAPFHSLPSDFPIENRRIYMPTDTADLNFKIAGKAPRFVELQRLAKTCRALAKKGLRSLVLVISNDERDAFTEYCREQRVDLLTYDKANPAKSVLARFQSGDGEVLAGTVRHYGRGIDLPNELAPFIFSLRPGYPRTDDPEVQFEMKKWGSFVWRLWGWRVQTEAGQLSSRNIRTDTDRGVTFFISQQFREFVYGSMPEYLKPAYKGQMTFNQCLDDALALFGKK